MTNLVAGEWVPAASGRTYERRNPAALSEHVGHFPDSGRADVQAAVNAARTTFGDWSARRGADRSAVLAAAADLAHERADEIARDLTRETGKPIREARAEVARLATTLRYFAADAWFPSGEVYGQSAGAGQVYTRRRPVGVVGLVTPWNFPVAIPAWKLAPALVTGNTVVLKPSEEAPLSALHLARCLIDGGLPAGALATAQRFVGATQAGVIHVNSRTTGAEVHVPFGGIKASGWGPHEQGRAAIDFYTDLATVYVDA